MQNHMEDYWFKYRQSDLDLLCRSLWVLCRYTQNYPIKRVLDWLWDLKGREGKNSDDQSSNRESMFDEFL